MKLETYRFINSFCIGAMTSLLFATIFLPYKIIYLGVMVLIALALFFIRTFAKPKEE